MRRLDRRAVAELGIPGAVLMENAGRGAAEAIVAYLGRARKGARVVIVCGKGGNGGDGFVVARWLARRGARPRVLLAVSPDEITGDAARKLDALRRSGARPVIVEDDAVATPALARADLVVDALLGTGTRGAPAGLIARMIERINASGRPVVALDVPSGLPADGGSPPGPAIRATMTLTFAGLKRGLVEEPGADLAGRVQVVPIGIPQAEALRGVTTFVLEASDVARHFPSRPRRAHKGTYGHLLIVAGSLGKTGAAALAARAAMRSGAGLVTVATPASQQPVVAGLTLEAMTEPLPETAARTIGGKAREVVVELAAARDAVALGPGLGLDPETQEVVRVLARDLAKPLALDADALTALAGHLDLLRSAPAPRCLTPHPGEMARMLGVSVADVQRDRVACAREFATTWGAHVVLKGAGSIIGSPDGSVWLNPTGNAGMASGGTGDVLTGILGALLARGLPPGAALGAAVYLHGRAGDIARARVGEESLIAGDVIAALPEAFAELPRAPGRDAGDA
ncbi:MAG: NAD(P)H-hydrate dehydratase [Candidatus Rokubacteria bacterium]|nr:NAD(P)H-hydrate dehydratase [Candidatus Rokubacteria bacterium]